jgi:Protein of unknown function (DUF3300)
MHRGIPPASLVITAALAALRCASSFGAETYTPQPTQPPFPAPSVQAPAMPAPQPAMSRYEALVAPIALYPDPLVALILPASTVPADINAASAYMIQYGDATRIDRQPWDKSVRGLAHYPTILAWMAANMEWTEALGFAFISSPAEVMEAIQQLRSRALASGALVSTPQQRVFSENCYIEILPSQPDSVCVPAYDDSVVYSENPYDGYAGPFISFGDPCAAGPWLSFYFDWGRGQVWSGDPRVWREHRGWLPPPKGGENPPPGAHRWDPPEHRPGGAEPAHPYHGNGVPLPQPMPGAPKPPPGSFRHPGAVPGTPPFVSSAPSPGTTVAVQPHPAAPVTARDDPPPSRPSAPGTSAPVAALPRPVAPVTVRENPPPPPRSYAPEAPRSSESYASHSEPARVSAPASAPAPGGNSGNQQPQK